MEFVYNNAKNINTNHMLFKLNYRYYACISYKKNFDPQSKSRTAEELFSKLKKLMIMYQQNLYHV